MDFYIKHYSQLIDYVVTGFEFEEDEFGGEPFPVLSMMHPSGDVVRVVVSSDEEGNGAGFLFVEEVKAMNREELVAAMDAGLPVRWKNDGYQLYRGMSGEYLQTFEPNGSTIGVFHRDGVGMNVDPKDCYIKESK